MPDVSTLAKVAQIVMRFRLSLLASAKVLLGTGSETFLPSFAVANQAQAGICALAGDSDGIDGTEDTAGAIVTPDTLTRGRAAGRDVPRYLTAHHNFSYFDALGDLVRTGPTLTHVDDIRAILIS